MTEWCKGAGLGRRGIHRLCELRPHAFWGSESKPHGCAAILGKIEDESGEGSTMENELCMGVAILEMAHG